MNEEEKSLLDDVIVNLIEGLDSLDDGSREKSSAVDDIAKLYRLKVDEMKVLVDEDDKYNRRVLEDMNFQKDIEFRETQLDKEMQAKIHERELKEQELKELKFDRWYRTGLAVFEIVATIIAYNCWTNKGFRFEEEGTIRSNTTKNIFMRAKKPKVR